MKYIKKISIILLAMLASIVTLVIMWYTAWKPLSEMTELGYQELIPAAKATKPITLRDGQQSTEYYVVLEVETVDGTKKLYLRMSEAYDEDDLLRNLENYRNGKKVEGYYFYSDTTGEVYFSKELTTATDYMESKAKTVIGIVLVANAFLIVIVIFTILFGMAKLPDIPGGIWSEKQLVICRYNTFSFGFVLTICMGMSGMCMWAVYGLCRDATSTQDYIYAAMFLIIGLMFLGLAIVFILWMKNYVVIFYPQGIVYRNALGKIYSYCYEQVKDIRIIRANRNHSMKIKTEEKTICLNYYCTNFYEAEELVEARL